MFQYGGGPPLEVLGGEKHEQKGTADERRDVIS